MLKKILIILFISSFGLILSCGAPLQTNSFSPMSLAGVDVLALPQMIYSISPSNTSNGISINTTVRIQFALDMLSSSINNTTITLSDSNNTPVSGSVTYSSSRTATFTPSSSLSYSATYTITLTTGILDAMSNPLPYTVHSTFTSVDAGTVPAPEFSLMGGTYYGSQTTSIACSESGVMISYTTDGTTPSRTNGTLVASGASISMGSPQTLRAMAYDPSDSKIDSVVTSAQYFITAAPPVFSPTGATYSSNVTVAISSSTAGAAIYYTTDGSIPTISSMLYSAPVAVTGHGTVMTFRAIAIASGLAPSNVTTETYRIMYNQAATPTFSPSGGTHTADQSVTLYSSTGGAVIYYTTDGTAPTTSSAQYSGPIDVAGNGTTMTINAMAVAPGYLNSPPLAQTYTINYPPADSVQFLPGGGSFTTDTSVNLSCSTPGAVIYYTDDGSAPTTSSAQYSGAITVSGNGADVTIRAMAVATGYSASAITQENYKINWLQVSTPTFDKLAGTYGSPLDVAITTGTPGATIHYSTNGTDWYSGTPYASTATVTIVSGGPVTIQAYATALMMIDSTYAVINYDIDIIPPTVSSVMVDGIIAEGARDVGNMPAIEVTFDDEMNPSSVTANVSINTCSGSLQVSSDGFITCVSMASAPIPTGGNRIFTINPSAPLDPSTIYQIRVTTPARDKAGNITTGYSTSVGFVTEVSGFVDTTFGSGSGYAAVEVAPPGAYDDDAQAVLVQPDGKIVIGGFCDNTDLTGGYDYVMGRYDAYGNPDSGFNGGISYYNFSSSEQGYDIAMQSGGRIILAGSDEVGFHLAGFDSNGNVVGGFGESGGYTVTDVALLEYGASGSCAAYAMAVDSSDRIYMAGNVFSSLNLNDFALVRYDPNGIRNASFGGNGIATTNFNPTRNEGALALAIQSDGRIVVVGSANDGTKNNFAVARFDTFGNTDMKRVIDFGSNAVAEAVALHPDGRILVAGHANNQIALARLNSDGSMDFSFSFDGMLMVPFQQAGNVDRAHAVALQKNGKILVTGISMNSMNYDVVVARLLDNGDLDPTFGMGGGVSFFPIGAGNDMAYDMKLQSVDGRIVVAGNFFNGSSNAYDIFVLRIK